MGALQRRLNLYFRCLAEDLVPSPTAVQMGYRAEELSPRLAESFNWMNRDDHLVWAELAV